MSVEDQQHYAEDAGDAKEKIDAITEAKNTLSFEAVGVLVPKDAEEKKATRRSRRSTKKEAVAEVVAEEAPAEVEVPVAEAEAPAAEAAAEETPAAE